MAHGGVVRLHRLELVIAALVVLTTRRADATPAAIVRKPPIVLRAVAPTPAPGPPSVARSATVVVGRPDGLPLLQALGEHATDFVAPGADRIGALVALPSGAKAEALGLRPVAPGIGRLLGRPDEIEAFGLLHPDLRVEIGPMLHPLMDLARNWVGASRARSQRGAMGRNVLIGVADSGLDVTHPDFRDASGKSRVKWMLDLSLEPTGRHPELEQRFVIRDKDKKVLRGAAVFSKEDIDELLQAIDSGTCVETPAKRCAPTDEAGHGTHVTGIAAGSGDLGPPVRDANGVVQPPSPYGGIAPMADIVFVRVKRDVTGTIINEDFVTAAEFLFDRADAERRPLVANFSLGADFGPHDGKTLWEKAIASHVGPDKPGHAIVAAAGNSGSIVEKRIHQSVWVSKGGTFRVPIATEATSGAIQIWVTLRAGADLRIGLEAPGEVWIPPVEEGRQSSIRKGGADGVHAGVVHGAKARKPKDPDEEGEIPDDSRSAIVLWTGKKWPSGIYNVTFEGTGAAELYVTGVDVPGVGRAKERVSFVHGVREGTVNQPATHPSILGVGCTVNRTSWTSLYAGLQVPTTALLDAAGWTPNDTQLRPWVDGEVCFFSSAGPTATGVAKPEIAAPGGWVVSAKSRNAMFGEGGIIDPTHAILQGTSMASPVVAGIVALLFEQDPTLTQGQILALLQAGAHRFRGPAPFDEQSGPGEADAIGALDALAQMKNPALALPNASTSWITLSSSYVAADGSRPTSALVELRTQAGDHAADLFDPSRLVASLVIDGKPVTPPPEMKRRGPGVFLFEWTAPPGLGGKSATFGATFDGAPIVQSKTLAIATDGWRAHYPSHASGSGCSSGSGSSASNAGAAVLVAGLLFTRRGRRGKTRA
jgi:MYXO-CTERM domain-containing protein